MRELAALAATLLTIATFAPYIVAVVRGRLRPSPVSWAIWSLGTTLVVAAQLSAGAGIGAWPLALSAAITASVAVLAARHAGATRVSRLDLGCLALALAAAAGWWVTRDAVVAVVLLTLLDLAGFGPVLRRAHTRPEDESAAFYAAGALRNALLLGAMEAWNVATVLFPAGVGVACAVVACWLGLRRRVLRRVLEAAHSPASTRGTRLP